ncbi:hypothetical protein M5K25_019650 [Dendrobium thyrsiflorum]|uniref:DUF4283 domain-containing protein n=1 Tax=Dendrobium thyrsiflorum TaxID=117978 RepID=A0ABD0UMC9_DENTH
MADFSSMDFPTLRPIAGGTPPPPSRNWKSIVVDFDPSSKDIPLSYLPKEPEIIPFAGERLSKGAEDWKLCLVGYSVGRRPFYEALLKAIRNTWKLKGSFQLLSLSDGFFLLRFTSMEDYDMAWSKGVWFFLVTAEATFPDDIAISLDDEVFSLKVQYEWKPTPCVHCQSLTHYSASCPTKPETAHINNPEPGPSVPPSNARGRSMSRRSRNKSASPQIRNSRNLNTATDPPNPSNTNAKAPNDPALLQPHSSKPHTPSTNNDVLEQTHPNTIHSVKSHIPNLNSPMEETSSSNSTSLPACSSPHNANNISPNKFGVLQTVEEEQEHTAGSSSNALESDTNLLIGDVSIPPPTRSQASKSAKGKQNRINVDSLQNPFFHHNHAIFPSEQSCNNFELSSSGRIWVKWNAIKLKNARTHLWDQLRSCVPSQNTPWIVMGDFNCCRFASEKIGGNALTQSSLGELNSMIFDANLTDLPSIGNTYTWFNQRQENPIHIKLDRILVNEYWMNNFPNTYYSIQAPSCSDHCPLILQNSDVIYVNHHFMFKNYWTSLDSFWYLVLDVFSARTSGNPIYDFCGKLKSLKFRIKGESWANSNNIQDQLDDLHAKQLEHLGLLSAEPNSPSLITDLKRVNQQISDLSTMQASWIIQRAKASWLSQGEDNLKFLYARIKRRMALRNSAINLSSSLSPLRAEAVGNDERMLLSLPLDGRYRFCCNMYSMMARPQPGECGFLDSSICILFT